MAKSRTSAYSLGAPYEALFPKPVVATRNPTTSDKNYEIGQVWVNKSSNNAYILTSSASGSATWSIASPGASDVDTLTGDSGGAISPAGGNITIAGGSGVTTSGSGSTITISAATGYAPITLYVVDAGGSSDYTTVQAAINAANGAGGGMVFVRPGTYTEDLTLYDNIYLFGSSESATTIAGTHTPPASGDINFWRLTLSDATAIFSSAAAGTTNIIVEDCTVAVTNGHMFDLANWTGTIAVDDLGFTGTSDGFINNTGGATVVGYGASIGIGTGQSCSISGTFQFVSCPIACPVDFVTGATGSVDQCQITGGFTFSNNSTGSVSNSRFTTGATAAVTMSSSAAWTLSNNVIDSSANPCIAGAGAGTLSFGALNFLNNSAFAGTLTLSRDTSVDGTVRALTFDTDVAAAAMTISATDIDADGTDANISVTVTPKGTGTFTVDSGGISNTAGDIISSSSNAAADNTVEVTNSDNTDPASRAGFEAAVGGASAGDPYVNFLISGGQAFTMGIDNSSTNDDFVISDAAALGTNDRITVDGSSGDVTVGQNLIVGTAGKELHVKGGAVTDFIGQATLASGTVTVANTNIAAGDRIICTRSSINGSTALGVLITSISAATSFTITAVQPGTPGSTETNDTSIVDYFIVRSV
ncbi:MAG: hypothetical protein PVF65_06025 [Sphingomonadales bacterium]|jgi:hypothetical protein